jgi:hypothetical protein
VVFLGIEKAKILESIFDINISRTDTDPVRASVFMEMNSTNTVAAEEKRRAESIRKLL